MVAFGTFTPTSTTEVATSICVSPEANHSIVFFLGLHCTVEEPYCKFVKNFFFESLRFGFRGFCLERIPFCGIRFFNARTDYVCLPSLRKLAPHRFVCNVSLARFHNCSSDRYASGWKFV